MVNQSSAERPGLRYPAFLFLAPYSWPGSKGWERDGGGVVSVVVVVVWRGGGGVGGG